MKINHRIKIFIALLSLLYLITLVQDTYAKYTSSANANTNITISRWNILVNDQDIKNNSNFTNTIKPTFEENENIASGVPGNAKLPTFKHLILSIPSISGSIFCSLLEYILFSNISILSKINFYILVLFLFALVFTPTIPPIFLSLL